MTLKDYQFLKGINISTRNPITLENRGEYALSTVDILLGLIFGVACSSIVGN